MPVSVPCAHCGASCDRRPNQVTPGYKAFCNNKCKHAYRKTPEGKRWQKSWNKPCTILVPHYAKKEVLEHEQTH